LLGFRIPAKTSPKISYAFFVWHFPLPQAAGYKTKKATTRPAVICLGLLSPPHIGQQLIIYLSVFTLLCLSLFVKVCCCKTGAAGIILKADWNYGGCYEKVSLFIFSPSACVCFCWV
jgi:hypothetical protein